MNELPIVRAPGRLDDIKVPEFPPLKESAVTMSFVGFWIGVMSCIVGLIALIIFLVFNETHAGKGGGASFAELPMDIIGGFALYILGLLLLCLGCLILVIVFGLVLYRGWSALQIARYLSPGQAGEMPSPAVAVGFCFIPLFQYYWFFVACRGISKYGMLVARERGIPYVGPGDQLCNVIPVLMIVMFFGSMIPYLGVLVQMGVGLVIPIVAFIFIKKINNMLREMNGSYTVRALV